MKILVTGASGFLGTKVMKLFKDHLDDFELVGTSSDGKKGNLAMDITKEEDVNFVLQKTRPDVVLHIAAYTDVDGCETNRDLAQKVNVTGTRIVTEACKKINAKIIFVSTDFVFDGKKGDYKEDDLPKPLSYYAMTKLEGEKIVQRSGLRYLIIRPEVLYGYNGDSSERSFVNWVVQSLKEGKEIRIVKDQFSTPTLVDDIADALVVLIKKGREGIYHVAGSEKLSKYDMAIRIAEVFSFKKSLVKQIITAQLNQKAVRPADSSLNIEKLKKEGILTHDFTEGLKIMKKQMENKA